MPSDEPMTISTEVSNEPERRVAGHRAAPTSSTGRRNLLMAMFTVVGGLGVVGAVIGAFANPTLAPVLAPLAVVIGAAALCGAVGTDRERALQEARQRAEAASEAKSNFLATVSHEFRSPLNGILGLTGLLLESKLTPEQETYARGVRSSGEALLVLVDEMLDFSRIEAGRFDLRPEPTDITALLQDIGELLAGRAHAKGIDLAVDVGRDMPGSGLVDAARLRQVLVNLVDNAIKFTESGGVVLRGERQSGAAAGSERIAFSVEDSGPGIDATEVERVFAEFEQVERVPGRRHGGAGLGLAISRRIVRRMASDIALRPRAGGGACFSFALDLAVAEDRRDYPEGRLAATGVVILSPGGSEPDVLARGLAEAGATVRIAGNLADATCLVGGAQAQAPAIDVLLVDQRAEPDPVDALLRLRAAARCRLPAVILIEPGKRSALAALRTAGFDAYLVRPVRRCSLVGIVADVVSGPGSFRSDPEDNRPGRPVRRPRGLPLDVLLAEDNEINALLVRSVLESLGHRVTEAHDGTSAIDAVTRGDKSFSAILLDLHMPGLDGIAAAGLIRDFEKRAGRRRAKILAVTADVLAETRARAIAAGIDAVLEKPVSPETLRQALAGLESVALDANAQSAEPSAG
jgi:signal transduction histidine kinase/CheY-like chemotaxis protein